MTSTTLPQARIPLGWVIVDNNRLPVEIDMEWMRALSLLLTTVTTGFDATTLTQLLLSFVEAGNTTGRDNEIRNEIEQLKNEVANRDLETFRLRIETLEGRLG